MPEASFADGVVKPASEWTEEVGEQIIARVTSAGHPSAGLPMRVIGETDNLALLADDGTDFREIMRLGSWHSFTPTIDGAGATDPAQGNGTWSGSYFLLGALGIFQWSFVFGSTDTFGSAGGEWRLVLPDGLEHNGDSTFRAGHFWAVDSSTGTNNRGMMPLLSSTSTLIRMQVTDGASTLLAQNGPFTWDDPDVLAGYVIVPLAY